MTLVWCFKIKGQQNNMEIKRGNIDEDKELLLSCDDDADEERNRVKREWQEIDCFFQDTFNNMC